MKLVYNAADKLMIAKAILRPTRYQITFPYLNLNGSEIRAIRRRSHKYNYKAIVVQRSGCYRISTLYDPINMEFRSLRVLHISRWEGARIERTEMCFCQCKIIAYCVL